MTKILLVGDIHLMDRPPRNRSDDYLEEVLELLRHTVRLERELGCDAVIWAGDVFHHKQPSRTSHRTVLKAIEVVQQYQNLWIVTGNHDISNDVLSTVHEQQPLGVLYAAGAQELVGWHPHLPVFGIPWQQRWLHEGVVEEVFDEWRRRGSNSSSLAVTHAPIFPPGTDVIYEHLDLEDISTSMQNQGYLYYGHIHEDHGIYEYEGVTFGNVGAISRGSLTEYNQSRQVQVALWEPEVGFTSVPLPARPASEVFRIEEAAEKKQQRLDLNDFLAEVGSTTLKISSSDSVITHISSLDVEEPVKKTAIELLEAAG